MNRRNLHRIIFAPLCIIALAVGTVKLSQPDPLMPRPVVSPRIESDFFAPYKDSYHLRLCPAIAASRYCVSYEREGDERATFAESKD
jgi:hypothetical protein